MRTPPDYQGNEKQGKTESLPQSRGAWGRDNCMGCDTRDGTLEQKRGHYKLNVCVSPKTHALKPDPQVMVLGGWVSGR